jgi:hypothetical protein
LSVGCVRLAAYLPRPEKKDVVETGDQPTVRLVAHCRRCHDWLLSPQSVAQGIGPTCAIRERVELRAAASRQFRELPLFDVMAPDQMNDPVLVGADLEHRECPGITG